MAKKSNVVNLTLAPTMDELLAELAESDRNVLDAMDFMVKIQELTQDSKAVSDSALAKGEKWWRYEIENRNRIQNIISGKAKYSKRVKYHNIPQGQEALEEIHEAMDKVENIPSPDALVKLENDKADN